MRLEKHKIRSSVPQILLVQLFLSIRSNFLWLQHPAISNKGCLKTTTQDSNKTNKINQHVALLRATSTMTQVIRSKMIPTVNLTPFNAISIMELTNSFIFKTFNTIITTTCYRLYSQQDKTFFTKKIIISSHSFIFFQKEHH